MKKVCNMKSLGDIPKKLHNAYVSFESFPVDDILSVPVDLILLFCKKR